MQFGVLVTAGCCGACSLGLGARGHVVWGAATLRDWRPGARGRAVWGAGGCCFASLTSGARGHPAWLLVEDPHWWMLFCELDGQVTEGMLFGALV